VIEQELTASRHRPESPSAEQSSALSAEQQHGQAH
jgi:hypothetical protein